MGNLTPEHNAILGTNPILSSNAIQGTHAGPTLAEQLCATINGLHQRGWCDGTGGNFSCVLSKEPRQLLMAPSGHHKCDLQPGELIVVDGSGQVIEGDGRASAETLLHLEIVDQTNAGAVLHTHSQAATLLSSHYQACGELLLQDLEMLKGLEGIRSHTTRISIPVLPNDQDLARLSKTARPRLGEAPYGLLIGGHGLYGWGSDLLQARRHIEILEFLLEQHWRALMFRALLGEPQPIQTP